MSEEAPSVTSPLSHRRLPIHFNLKTQKNLQISLSSSALIITALIIPANVLASGVMDIWVLISLTVAIMGVIMDILGLIGLLKEAHLLLTTQLLYNAAILAPFRVIYVILGLTGDSATSLLPAEITLTAILTLISFSQLYLSMYLFRLLRFLRAFQIYAGDEGGQSIPSDLLVVVFTSLGQHPSVTQLAELACTMNDSETGISFDDFCRIEHRYLLIAKRGRSRPRQHRSTVREPLIGRQKS